MKILADIGEDALIERLLSLVPQGDGDAKPGDDCAVVDIGQERLQLLKTDALVEGVHFLREADPQAVGWKAIARVISDFAAMGGVGESFLVTIALPSSMQIEWIEGFYGGMARCLNQYDTVLVGGETCRVPEGSAAVISIAATGSVARDHLMLRSGGKPGDELWVTGKLGGSITGKHLLFFPRVDEAHWLAENFQVTAMMDLSDGLAKDLPRLAKASGCEFLLDHCAVPISNACSLEQALTDGEDFELLFAAAPGMDKKEWEKFAPNLELTKIGKLVAIGDGEKLEGGWDHFALIKVMNS